jgi:dethiobiotin synthase
METPGYFVTGSDTDVGKTVVASWLMLALDGEYWKPVQAGLDGETDEAAVRRLTGLPAERFHGSAYRLKAALSPHEAATREGIAIEMARFKLPPHRRPLVVEGAGGLLVPLNDRDLVIDLIAKLGLPAVLVARSTLGTINHTLLSLEALRARRIAVAGVVIDGPANAANREAIATYGNVPVIAELPVLDPLDRGQIALAAARIRPKLPAMASPVP